MMTLATRIRHCARLSGSFTLHSGKISDPYFDKYQFEADPKLLHEIGQEMAKLLPPETAGLEMGGISVATALSFVTRLSTAFIRKQPKSYGTCR
jgi:orotate phosphoribosyltransferase